MSGAIEKALASCKLTYKGPGRCDLPEYLFARYEYHKLLVRAKMLDSKLAEKKPQGHDNK